MNKNRSHSFPARGVDLTATSPASVDSGRHFMSGFGNAFATEAEPGALPKGQNSPQNAPLGLYVEQLSGTAFTAPRAQNWRSWLYRIHPTAAHRPFRRYDRPTRLQSAPFNEIPPSPNRLRWNPFPAPDQPTDFLDGLFTIAGNGDVSNMAGTAVHIYAANRSMRDRAFCNADGEMLIIPQSGGLIIVTELGVLAVAPGSICVIPRGLRFRVELADTAANGYVCENYGAPFRLPELGPIGANGLANPRDFLTPTGAYETDARQTELVQKFQGLLWTTTLDRSPFDVVAWHGNLAPYQYDLASFNAMGTISFDHPDPSIFTVLTSPSETAGTANVEFAIFPPRWAVAEHTFRPPWFHRNVMSEFVGLIDGEYDAKADGFLPGGCSLHNCMAAHGPDLGTYSKAIADPLVPHKIGETMAFVFESRAVLRPTRLAMEAPQLQTDYDDCWQGFPVTFEPPEA